MPINRLHPEIINLVAEHLDTLKDVFAFEQTCKGVRNAVQSAAPSSTCGRIFKRDTPEPLKKAIELALEPPRSYRDALRQVTLTRRVGSELQKIQCEAEAVQRVKTFYRMEREHPDYSADSIAYFGSGMWQMVQADVRSQMQQMQWDRPSTIIDYYTAQRGNAQRRIAFRLP